MGETMILTGAQRKFLGKCRKDPKPIADMLWECQVGLNTFLAWCREKPFAREFRAASAGLTADTLSELRMAFAVSGRMLASEVFSIHAKRTDKPRRGKKAAARQEKLDQRPHLTDAEQRLCFDVLKLGMTAFVPKAAPRKRRGPTPKIKPESLARLQRAQQQGAQPTATPAHPV
jgi:hypothetical protein